MVRIGECRTRPMYLAKRTRRSTVASGTARKWKRTHDCIVHAVRQPKMKALYRKPCNTRLSCPAWNTVHTSVVAREGEWRVN